MSDLPETVRQSVAGNVARWSQANHDYGDASAARSWAAEEIRWGMFGVPEESIGSPLGDVEGMDIAEVGCGTAYFSAWLARRGARPVAIDPTPAQLETARRLQRETGIEFPLLEGIGERIPLPHASIDMVLSEYGACLWADPYLWVPEVRRVLRPGGRLVFLTQSLLSHLCCPDVGAVGETLQRSQFGAYDTRWPDEPGTEYHLGHGDWIRLLHEHGFEIDDLIELQVPEDAEAHEYYGFVSAAWARKWPPEEIWVAHLRGGAT